MGRVRNLSRHAILTLTFAAFAVPVVAAQSDAPQSSGALDPQTVSRALANAGLPDVERIDRDDGGNASLALLTACSADFNTDGFLSFEDFDTFVAAFEAGLPSSDLNGDGFLTFDDFDAFVQAFDAGCAPSYNGPLFPGPVFYAGGDPQSVAIGDLDGDGRPDLVIANGGPSLLMLRNLGNGAFAYPVVYATNAFSMSVAIGDLNGDGRPDIVVANYNNSAIVLRNTSPGRGIVSFAAPVDFPTGPSPIFVAIGDLGGDGKPDIVVANYNGNTVSVLRNTSSGGGAVSFDAKVDFATGAVPIAVAIGDLDGDDRPDLVVANSGSNTASVLRNASSGGGDIDFAARIDFATGSNPRSVTIGDLDADGKPDLAVANYSSDTASVLRNTSSGVGTVNFAAKIDYATGSNQRSVAIDDLDADGKPDLVIVNGGSYTVSVLRNLGNSALAARVDYATGALPVFVAIGDLDGDHKPDLVVANSLGRSVSVLRNLGDGAFAARVDNATGSLPISVANGDLDGDGRHDLVVANASSGTISVLRNLGSGEFAARVDYATGGSPRCVALGDVDGDGKLDLVVANSGSSVSVLRNTSSGVGNVSFAAKVDFATGAFAFFLAIDDLDGDGRPDLVVANANGNSVSVLRNTSLGADNVSFAAKVDCGTGSNPRSIAIGDVDGDGMPDLVVGNSSSNTASVLRNTSSGGGDLSFAAKVDYATGSAPSSVALGDLDGDGRPDLAVANYSSNTASVLRNISSDVGDVSFAAKVDHATGSNPRSVAIRDLNGDGSPDLAVTNYSSNTVSEFRTLGNGAFAPRIDYATGEGPWSIAIGDLDADGRPDLVVANYDSYTVSVLRNQSGNVSP